MNKKKILHKLILAMSGYISCGVPKPVWKLVKRLTKEIYGDYGVQILKVAHETYEDEINSEESVILHEINEPEKVIEQLENHALNPILKISG